MLAFYVQFPQKENEKKNKAKVDDIMSNQNNKLVNH